MAKKRVVVLGAGYGGIFAAAHLCKYDAQFDTTIIDKNPYHQLLQQIHFLVSGFKTHEEVTISVGDLFKSETENRNICSLIANVDSVDLDGKTIHLRIDGNRTADILGYDYVIIALGAKTHYFGVDGAERNCLSFRSVQDALKIREKVNGLSKNSSVVIVGGGPTGVSLTAALLELLRDISSNSKVTLVESSPTLLPGWDTRLSATASDVLARKGAKTVTGRSVASVSEYSVTLDSGDELHSDCTIWTAGIRGNSIQTSPHVETTKSGRIIVDPFSRVEGFEHAFAIGDISEFRPGPGRMMNLETPQLAQFAVRQARFVAENIFRAESKMPMNDELGFHQRGHTIALGNDSIGLLGGLLISGRMANYAEDSIVDNFISEFRNKKSIVTKAQGIDGEISSPTSDFVPYATSQALWDLVQ